MNWYKNVKISARLIAGFLIVAVIAGVIGLVGILSLNSVNSDAKILYEKATEPMVQLSEVLELYLEIRVDLRNLILLEDETAIYKTIDTLRSKSDQIMAIMDECEKTAVAEKTVELFENFDSSFSEYIVIMEQIIRLVQTGDKEEAGIVLLDESMANAATTAQDSIEGLVDQKAAGGASQYELILETSRSTKITMIILLFFGLVIALVFGLLISGSISKPIREIVDVANQLALGDIDVNIKNEYNDETGELAKAFRALADAVRNQTYLARRLAEGDFSMEVEVRSEKDVLGKALNEMIGKINDLMTSIAFSSEQVANGSKQISESSAVLSEGSTEQATAIEQLTASLEEIASQTENNANNANKANELTKGVKASADEGNNQMKEMLKAMEEINVSSNNINRIIKVIDDIAFQTNILALNAAVEAARAGQYGKGFAVVAEEVRTLAAKSADAAKETTELIGNSIGKVNDGTKIAGKTADFLNSIVSEIDKVYAIVNDIAAASSEQAAGISQVNQGIIQVSGVVQINSSTAEETAAASEELAGQAELLQDMISKFRLRVTNYSGNDSTSPAPENNNVVNSAVRSGGSDFKDSSKSAKDELSIKLSDNEFGKY